MPGTSRVRATGAELDGAGGGAVCLGVAEELGGAIPVDPGAGDVVGAGADGTTGLGGLLATPHEAAASAAAAEIITSK